MDTIFIVKTIKLRKLTEEDLKTGFEMLKVRSKNWRNRTFKEYVEFEAGWDRGEYNSISEDNAYFKSLDEAKNFTINNTCDLNDGGVFNYAIIQEVPLNCSYAYTRIKSDYLFKFNRDTDKYEEIDFDSDNETRYLSRNYGK